MQRKNKVFLGVSLIVTHLKGVTFRYSHARGVAFCDGALMKRPRINQMDTDKG